MNCRYLLLIPVLGFAFLLGMAACGNNDDNGENFVNTITLPDGFRPEGVAISGTSLFVGSIPTGRIYRAGIRSGLGQVIIDPGASRSAIGLKVDSRDRLFVAGGQTGQAYVYDVRTGNDIAVFNLAEGTTFINDVIVTPDAAWFTDSRNPVLYRVPIGGGGSIGVQETVTSLTLTGDFQNVAGETNANGIAATPDGNILVLVQSNSGKLFKVTPPGGFAQEISLGGDSVVNGDGILLQGQTLFVVQNRLNKLAVITLSEDFETGTVIQEVTDPAFDVPTTVAATDGSLFLVNARFGIADPDTAGYTVVRIDKP